MKKKTGERGKEGRKGISSEFGGCAPTGMSANNLGGSADVFFRTPAKGSLIINKV